MPIYTYECRKCGVRKEVMQGYDDAPLGVCDKCGGELKKLIIGSRFTGFASSVVNGWQMPADDKDEM
jgi:putative FmdB family regulatory protein